MPSQVLDAWYGWVDGLGLPAQQTETLKRRGEQLYIAAGREGSRHWKKHAQALRADGTITAAQKNAIDAVCDRAIAADDTAWLAMANGI